jgi:nitroreductase
MRAFLNKDVDLSVLRQILQAASHSPSGTNTQPWNVVVLTGEARRHLCERVSQVRADQPERERGGNVEGEYKYYSQPMTEPYLSRRRKVGWDMYQALGIQKGDMEGSWAAAGRNYLFFDAPVGLIFTLERVLEKGSWIDMGVFLQSVMIGARHFGLDTCAQGAWARYHDIIRVELGIPQDQVIVCGMALGYADADAPVNRIGAERVSVESFARFLDHPQQEGQQA